MKQKISCEEGVSPVVGVMLMLVVTIIIAAVVSGFAGGLAGDTEETPTAAIDVNIELNYDSGWGGPAPAMLLRHNGGDTLKTEDLQIITYYTVPKQYLGSDLSNAGKVIKHTIDGSLAPRGTNGWDDEKDPFTEPQINNDGLPSLNEIGVNNKGDFGEYLWRPGRTIQNWPRDVDYLVGFDIDDKDTYGFGEEAAVHVTIVHKPSGKFIYDEDVEVRY